MTKKENISTIFGDMPNIIYKIKLNGFAIGLLKYEIYFKKLKKVYYHIINKYFVLS